MDKSAEYKLVKKAVNNKALFNSIHQFVDEGIIAGGILWSNDIHRQSFIDVIGDFLDDLMFNGIIDQWNVISDLRNNTIRTMDAGTYVIDITYRQKNCLNTTRLTYTVQDMLIANIKELLDFELKP